jgi:hypothetical protein
MTDEFSATIFAEYFKKIQRYPDRVIVSPRGHRFPHDFDT